MWLKKNGICSGLERKWIERATFRVYALGCGGSQRTEFDTPFLKLPFRSDLSRKVRRAMQPTCH